ncbi:MAG: ferrous iron transport protein A [Ruminococcaceae bacterium]|nr:ferrous iron transport protein A [Oscillospiraceae bacterium]
MDVISLDKVRIGDSCTVLYIRDDDNNKNFRLYDLGVVKNTVIVPLFKSMFGDTIAYKIKGSVIALRKKDCKKIKVKLDF